MICTKCGADKSEGEFNWRNKTKGTRRSHCKICTSGWDNNHYAASKTRRNNLRVRFRERKQRNRVYVREYLLAHPCVDCPESDPTCLDFDHVREKKFRDISALVRGGYKLETLKKEIEKCDVRCANCHRKVTAKRRLVGRPGVDPDPLGFQSSATTALAHVPS